MVHFSHYSDWLTGSSALFRAASSLTSVARLAADVHRRVLDSLSTYVYCIFYFCTLDLDLGLGVKYKQTLLYLSDGDLH